MLEEQTVLMHSVMTWMASIGAERQAQSWSTSSQPLGSARPIGLRQLKTQGAADWRLMTAGTAVMV